MDKNGTVCFTGHRVIPPDEKGALLSRLYSCVMELYLSGYRSFICGGAVGFDTEAAECVIAMRERFGDGISLSLYLPCRDQTERWNNIETLRRYKNIQGKADRVEYISDFYTESCMLERNRRMVDDSSLCVAYMTARRGGTAYTVKYAEKSGIRIINLGTADENGQLFIDIPEE